MRQIIFDTETTGFDPAEGHRLVEIGCVEMMNGALSGESFHRYVNPERDMPTGAFQVHGLSADFLSDKPLFADNDVGEAFLDFIGDAELVAHNAGFDMRFIKFEVERAGLGTIDNGVIDTLQLARKKFPGSPNSLDALCKRFDISLANRDKHGALIDAELLAAVYVELTGGAQGGLELKPAFASDAYDETGAGLAPIGPRPAPLASLITAAERSAHDAFVAELGENAIWREIEA